MQVCILSLSLIMWLTAIIFLLWESYSLSSVKMMRLRERKLEAKMLGICEATAPEVKKAQPIKVNQIQKDNYCLKCPYRTNNKMCEECEFYEI